MNAKVHPGFFRDRNHIVQKQNEITAQLFFSYPILGFQIIEELFLIISSIPHYTMNERLRHNNNIMS